jgi:hypothetical protein
LKTILIHDSYWWLKALGLTEDMNSRKKRPNRTCMSSVQHTRPKRLRLSRNGLPPVYNDNKLARASINHDDYDDHKNYDDNAADEYEYSSGDDDADADADADADSDADSDDDDDDDDDDSVPSTASIHRKAKNNIDTEPVMIKSLSSEELSKHQKRIASKLFDDKHTIKGTEIVLINEYDMKTDNPLVSGLTRLIEHDIIVDNNPIKPISMRNSLAKGRGLGVRLTRQSISDEIKCITNNDGISNNVYARPLTSDITKDPDEPLLDGTFVRLGNLKGTDSWKMFDSAVPITPRLSRFDASIIEYTMQSILISKFPDKNYDNARVGTIDGILMFSYLYGQPKDCIPFAKVEDTIVYIHTIRRKLIVGKFPTRKVKQQTNWMDMYQKLVAYKKKHKSTNVPRTYAADPQLGRWVIRQRTNYNNNKLTAERINRLDFINFVWNPLEVEWTRMYQKLVAYKKKHKSTNVPVRYIPDPKLATWVSNQRTYYNNNKLSAERINRLDSINFVWDQWMETFYRLVEYKKQNKSTKVPIGYAKDRLLAEWVSTQRKDNNNGDTKRLSEKRVKLLNSIGFVWNVSDSQWMEMYQKLVEYKKQHKSTRVPITCSEDRPLVTWVRRQQTTYNKGKLLKTRKELLNSIDFAWS